MLNDTSKLAKKYWYKSWIVRESQWGYIRDVPLAVLQYDWLHSIFTCRWRVAERWCIYVNMFTFILSFLRMAIKSPLTIVLCHPVSIPLFLQNILLGISLDLVWFYHSSLYWSSRSVGVNKISLYTVWPTFWNFMASPVTVRWIAVFEVDSCIHSLPYVVIFHVQVYCMAAQHWALENRPHAQRKQLYDALASECCVQSVQNIVVQFWMIFVTYNIHVKVNELYRIMNHSVDEQVDCCTTS
jgi:hypothetical protein